MRARGMKRLGTEKGSVAEGSQGPDDDDGPTGLSKLFKPLGPTLRHTGPGRILRAFQSKVVKCRGRGGGEEGEGGTLSRSDNRSRRRGYARACVYECMSMNL